VLAEQELQDGWALQLSISEGVTSNPSIREKRCPGTPCVPARRDGHYVENTIELTAALYACGALLQRPEG
jgi:hypothetical protein